MTSAIKTLHPAYFGMVMATGIVSIAAMLHGAIALARPLFWINLIMFAVLWVLTILRIILFRQDFLTDLSNHSRAVGFFTIPAATSVMGTQIALVLGHMPEALVFWVIGTILAAIFTYTILVAMTIRQNKPTFTKAINGSWLLAVVAIQSVAVLGGVLDASMSTTVQEPAAFFCTTVWLAGTMMYIWIITLIFFRDEFFRFNPKEFVPTYWINMGAAAISSLAGSTLILHAGSARLILDTMPFVKGLTLMLWSAGTWWIPFLLLLELWRHAWHRFPLSYDPLYWAIVFPLGMYSVCTEYLSKALHLPFLLILSQWCFYVASIVWACTLYGLCVEILQAFIHPHQHEPQKPKPRHSHNPQTDS